jgi:hypothetical protein
MNSESMQSLAGVRAARLRLATICRTFGALLFLRLIQARRRCAPALATICRTFGAFVLSLATF